MRYCKGHNKDGSVCGKLLASWNKSGYCTQHHSQSPTRKQKNKENKQKESYKKKAYEYNRRDYVRQKMRDRENDPSRIAWRHQYARLESTKEKMRELNKTEKRREYCRNYNAEYIEKEGVKERRREYIRNWVKTPSGIKSLQSSRNIADITICIEDSMELNEGELRDFYTGNKVRLDGKNGKGKAVGEHIDSELKGTSDDGPHNWVLSEWSINTSKNNRCLYEWHQKEHIRLGLRPLDDILDDMKRLGKRIPKPR